MNYPRTTGFTVMELVIALAVVAILVSLAFPSYQESVRKGRRMDAKVALTDLANRLEKYYSDHNTYVGATLANVFTGYDSPEGYYALSIVEQNATRFTILAVRQGLQADDDKCGNFWLTYSGTDKDKGVSGGSATADDCW